MYVKIHKVCMKYKIIRERNMYVDIYNINAICTFYKYI